MFTDCWFYFFETNLLQKWPAELTSSKQTLLIFTKNSSENNSRGSSIFHVPLQDEMCNPTVALWSPPSWKSLEHLQSKVSWGHSNRMHKPPWRTHHMEPTHPGSHSVGHSTREHHAPCNTWTAAKAVHPSTFWSLSLTLCAQDLGLISLGLVSN